MTKYALFNERDELVARYCSDIHGDDVPVEAMEISDEIFTQTILESDGVWMRDPSTSQIFKAPFPPLTADQAIAELLANARLHMDQRAAEAGFRDISDAVSYADEDAVPALQAEARAFRAWRSVVMERWREVAAGVRAGGEAPEPAVFLQSLPDVTEG